MTNYQNTVSEILHGQQSRQHLPRCNMKIGKLGTKVPCLITYQSFLKTVFMGTPFAFGWQSLQLRSLHRFGRSKEDKYHKNIISQLSLFISFSDYTHYMHAIMNTYIKKCFKKSDPKKGFWIDICRTLYFCPNHEEMELIMFQMFVYGITKEGSPMSL